MSRCVSLYLVSCGVLGLSFTAGSLVAHPDDPKIKDTLPRYEGPSYRRNHNLNPGQEFPALGVDLMSWITLPEFGNHSGAMGCWGYTANSGREYAIIGLSNGTGFVEVTDPGNAQIVTVIPGPNSGWREVTVYGHYAYSVNESSAGIQVIDLSNIDNGVVTLVRSVITGGSQATHTISVNAASGYLYRNGGSGLGLRMYSLANPADPQYVGIWNDRYVHDSHIVTYTSGPYAGREIAFCCGGFNSGYVQPGLSIVDVTNKAAIQVLSHYQYPNAGYSHQCWLSSDKRYVYLDDEFDEDQQNVNTNSRIIDVQNLAAPVQIGTFSTGSTAIDHNQFVRGRFLYQANYTSGLHVFDVTTPTAPVRVAYFDTWPQNDQVTYNSLWNNYPYFPSGTVIGSDREKGLFVWRVVPRYDVTDVAMIKGTVVNGNAAALNLSDDQYLRTRSGYGSTFVDLHHTEVVVGLRHAVGVSESIDLAIESRLVNANGTARVRMRNWNTTLFEQVGQYAVGTNEQTVTLPDIDAATYVRESDGRVEVSIKQVVVVPLFAFQFESLFDLVDITGG